MDYVAELSPFVTSTSVMGDASPYTALGVLRGMQACAKYYYGSVDLNNLHVAIQGVGHVGHHLARLLQLSGARLTLADPNPEALKPFQGQANIDIVAPEAIFQVACDIFSPCALGAVINQETLSLLNTRIIAGAANNQLAESSYGEILQQRGIIYAPDYVISAGGLIYACAQYQKTLTTVDEKIATIYDTVLNILEQAGQEASSSHAIANRIAEEKLNCEVSR
jgi:leucine dehydrogenase